MVVCMTQRDASRRRPRRGMAHMNRKHSASVSDGTEDASWATVTRDDPFNNFPQVTECLSERGVDNALMFGERKGTHLCGIGTVVGVICCVSITASTMVGSVVQGEVCTDALNEIQEAGDNATTACFMNSMEMLEVQMLQLIRPTMQSMVGEFGAYIEEPLVVMERMRLYLDSQAAADKTPQWGRGGRTMIWNELKAQRNHFMKRGREYASRGLGFYWKGADGVRYGTTLFEYSNDVLVFDLLGRSPEAPWRFEISIAEPFDGAPMALPQLGLPLVSDIQDSSRIVDLLSDNASGRFEPGAVRWDAIDSIGLFVGLILGTVHTDIRGQEIGACVYAELSGISEQLRNVADKACAYEDACPAVRMFTAVRSTWDPRLVQPAGLLTGVSHGVAYERVPGPGGLYGTADFHLRALQDVNASDYIIRGIARWVSTHLGGYEAILNGSFNPATPGFGVASPEFQIPNLNNTTEKVYVSEYAIGVTNITDPVGLDWHMIYAVPTASVLEQVRTQQRRLAAEMDAEGERVERKARRSRALAVGYVIGLAVAFALLCTTLVQVLCVHPIQQIQGAMRNVATMDLDTADVEATSFMHDVRQMQKDFNVMVSNLLEFRAYVPSSLLVHADAQPKVQIEPPTGDVAIVFTDIKGSTALWQESAVGMDTALDTQNRLIRKLCDEHKGYEVKTIGDSFMVAFQSSISAVRFAVKVQEDLVRCDWPESLSLPAAGLVVRIGIHAGPAPHAINPISGRVDYRGDTVNKASRCEAKALPGTTCVSSHVHGIVADALPDPLHWHPLGEHELKGLGSGHALHLVTTHAQRHRCIETSSDCVCYETLPPRRMRAEVKVSIEATTRTDLLTADDVGSVRSDRTDSSFGTIHRRTGLQLVRNTVTIAVCRLKSDVPDSSMFDHINLMIRGVADCATAHGGYVGQLSGCTLTVSWNTAKRCHTHAISALRFADRVEGRTGGVVRMGMATGHLLHGNVGTQKLRFNTAIGLPFEAANFMAEYCEHFGISCLFCVCGTEVKMLADPSVQPCLRLIDVWEEANSFRRMHILEVDIRMARECEAMYASSDGLGHVEKETNTLHTSLLRTVLRDGKNGGEGEAAFNRLKALAEEEPRDLVLQIIVEQLSYSEPRNGCRTCVSLSRAPAPRPWRENPGGGEANTSSHSLLMMRWRQCSTATSQLMNPLAGSARRQTILMAETEDPKRLGRQLSASIADEIQELSDIVSQ